MILWIVTLHSYRKIPGDKCEGGTMPERKEIDLSQRCVSDLVGPELLVSFPTNQKLRSPHCMCHPHVNMRLCAQTETTSSKSVPIVVTVVIVMLLSVAGGVLFVKKYVCGGRSGVLSVFPPVTFVRCERHRDLTAAGMSLPCRFLVHRYSVLQQHVEDRAADSMDDPLETDHSQNGKIEFHEDSDEVDTSLFSRTKAGIETAAPAPPVELQRNQLHSVCRDE